MLCLLIVINKLFTLHVTMSLAGVCTLSVPGSNKGGEPSGLQNFVVTWISGLRFMFFIPVRSKVDDEKDITCNCRRQNLESRVFMFV